MRQLATLSLHLLAASALAGPQAPRIVWTVETSAPAERRLDLRYGETVALECRFLNYQTPLDITGAAVTLHARTNGMAEGYSYQLAGVAASNGLATVTLPVDAWLPRGLTSAIYALEAVQTNGVRILRATGTVALAGTASASSADPMPVSWASNVLGRIDAATNALQAAVGLQIAQAVAALPPQPTGVPVWIGTNGTEFATLEPGGIGMIWRVTYTSAWHFAEQQQAQSLIYPLGPFTNEEWKCFFSGASINVRAPILGVDWGAITADTNTTTLTFGNESTLELTNLVFCAIYGLDGVTNYITRFATTNDLANFASVADYALWQTNVMDMIQAVSNNAHNAQETADGAAAWANQAAAAVASKLGRTAGVATNLTLSGYTKLANTQPTNLIVRLSLSNDHIIVEHVIP